MLVAAALAGLALSALVTASGNTTSGQGDPSAPARAGASRTTDAPVPAVSAAVDKAAAQAGERVHITGEVADARAGVRLRVQRREDGSWVDFPAEARTSSGGRFSTYVELGRPGPNVLRMLVPSTGARSAPMTVRIG